MYGDAMDIAMDNDGNGIMDDLNGDGRINLSDARVIGEAVDRVEKKYPHAGGRHALLSAHGRAPGDGAHRHAGVPRPLVGSPGACGEWGGSMRTAEQGANGGGRRT